MPAPREHAPVTTGDPSVPYAYRGVLIKEWRRTKASTWQRFQPRATPYHPNFPRLFASKLDELLDRIDAEFEED